MTLQQIDGVGLVMYGSKGNSPRIALRDSSYDRIWVFPDPSMDVHGGDVLVDLQIVRQEEDGGKKVIWVIGRVVSDPRPYIDKYGLHCFDVKSYSVKGDKIILTGMESLWFSGRRIKEWRGMYEHAWPADPWTIQRDLQQSQGLYHCAFEELYWELDCLFRKATEKERKAEEERFEQARIERLRVLRKPWVEFAEKHCASLPHPPAEADSRDWKRFWADAEDAGQVEIHADCRHGTNFVSGDYFIYLTLHVSSPQGDELSVEL